MNNTRTALLQWLEQGSIPANAVSTALRLAGVTPSKADWRTFFDSLMLWLAATFCALGVIFFFAYNWQAIGELAKFGLLELLIIGSLCLCWRLDLNATTGKSALLFAALLIGALLALVGQTYQTGADTYELFTVWAIAILPWVLVSCFSALWLFWLGLINVAAILYYQLFGGFFGILFNFDEILWAIFTLNTVAWAVRELVAVLTQFDWLAERWSARVLAVVSGGIISTMAIFAIGDIHNDSIQASLLVYPVWMGLAYTVYRHILLDVFVLAGGVLSGIIFITVWLTEKMMNNKMDEAGVFLFIGFVIIGLSALGGFWLKSVAQGGHHE
ncbi:hypothetical protein BCS42_11930 [Crenothrix sp. D3]|nr:hypothetical protein BCS42_11930 [Crenothrix sp. D3]